MEHTKDPSEVWHMQQEKLLKKFSNLRSSDFHFDYGMKDVMMNKLQAKLGKSRAELNSLISAL
jgi:hypothetical protein